MSATNRGSARRKNDAYYTPESATLAIMPHLPRCTTVLDPFCGDGYMLKPFYDIGISVSGLDIDSDSVAVSNARMPNGKFKAVDTLSPGWIMDAELVVTNPPYSLAMESVVRCLRFTHFGGTAAFLLRLSWLASKKRKQFHADHPCDAFVLSARPSFTGDGKTDAADYAWFVYGPGRGERYKVL